MNAALSIPFVAHSTRLDADAQAAVATVLTLMTAYVHGDDESRERCARAIESTLHDLGEREDLDGQFRRLCGRLQGLWAAQGG